MFFLTLICDCLRSNIILVCGTTHVCSVFGEALLPSSFGRVRVPLQASNHLHGDAWRLWTWIVEGNVLPLEIAPNAPRTTMVQLLLDITLYMRQ